MMRPNDDGVVHPTQCHFPRGLIQRRFLLTPPAPALLNCPLPTHGSLWSAGQSPKVMEQHLGPFRTSFRFVAHFLFHPAKAPCTPSSGPFSVQVGTLWLLLPSPGCWLCLKFPPLSDHSPSQHKYFTYPSPKLQIT